MNRTTLALLIAPMWIPLGMEVYFTRGHSFGDAWVLSALYGFFGYLVSLSFGGSILDFLRARGWTKLWQFSLAGALFALVVTLLVGMLGIGRRLATGESLDTIELRHHFSFPVFVPIGALMAATIWLIAEWRVKRVR
jgi:uncharacterized membrane protein YedE/YeeE